MTTFVPDTAQHGYFQSALPSNTDLLAVCYPISAIKTALEAHSFIKKLGGYGSVDKAIKDALSRKSNNVVIQRKNGINWNYSLNELNHAMMLCTMYQEQKNNLRNGA